MNSRRFLHTLIDAGYSPTASYEERLRGALAHVDLGFLELHEAKTPQDAKAISHCIIRRLRNVEAIYRGQS